MRKTTESWSELYEQKRLKGKAELKKKKLAALLANEETIDLLLEYLKLTKVEKKRKKKEKKKKVKLRAEKWSGKQECVWG